MLKRRDECDTYLTHVCRHHWSRKPDKKMKYKELSANTVAFISCRRRLSKVLAGVAREERKVRVGETE